MTTLVPLGVEKEIEKAKQAKLDEEGDEPVGVKKAFINPIILEEEGKEWDYEEGCLSIPDLTADVSRKPNIVIEYYDEDFNLKEEKYDGKLRLK